MKKPTTLLNCISVLLYSLLAFSCQKPGQATSDKTLGALPGASSAHNGTVDGGGGDSILDPATKKRVLLDLAEGFDKEPFDYNYKQVLKIGDSPEAEVQKKLSAIGEIYNVVKLKRLLGSDNEFFVWAFSEAFQTSSEANNPYNDKTLYAVHSKAYALKAEQQIKNVRYAFTTKDLDPINDEGVLKVSNPETKKQVAAQDAAGFVLLNKTEFEKLDENSRLALRIHETMIYLMIKFNPELIKKLGTAPIRDFVRSLFSLYYTSKLNPSEVISEEQVRESFQKLNFPKIIPDYALIAKVSTGVSECKFAREGDSANYKFVKGSEQVSPLYSMDIEFYMKIQMHLVENGTCIFKPEDCTIVQNNSADDTSYHLATNGMILPDSSNDWFFVKEQLLKKYQQARICK